MTRKRKTIIFTIVVIIVVGCIIALVNRSYIARQHIKEEKIEKVVQTDIIEDVEKEILTVTTETGIVIRQYIPKEEKIEEVIRADVTGDGKKEIIVATVKADIEEGVTVRDSRIYILQRKEGEIQRWKSPFVGATFRSLLIEDINNDGKDEIVVLSISGNIWTINIIVWDGSTYKEIFDNGAKGGIELEDIDGDGIKEILLKGAPEFGSYEDYIYKWDGKKYYLYKTEKARS